MPMHALFIRHKTHPGRREDFRRIWEKHVKPRVETNPAHVEYFFCFDDADPDVVRVFQLYSDPEAMKAFLSGAWYESYLAEVAQVVAEKPQLMPASLQWAKGMHEPEPM